MPLEHCGQFGCVDGLYPYILHCGQRGSPATATLRAGRAGSYAHAGDRRAARARGGAADAACCGAGAPGPRRGRFRRRARRLCTGPAPCRGAPALRLAAQPARRDFHTSAVHVRAGLVGRYVAGDGRAGPGRRAAPADDPCRLPYGSVLISKDVRVPKLPQEIVKRRLERRGDLCPRLQACAFAHYLRLQACNLLHDGNRRARAEAQPARPLCHAGRRHPARHGAAPDAAPATEGDVAEPRKPWADWNGGPPRSPPAWPSRACRRTLAGA